MSGPPRRWRFRYDKDGTHGSNSGPFVRRYGDSKIVSGVIPIRAGSVNTPRRAKWRKSSDPIGRVKNITSGITIGFARSSSRAISPARRYLQSERPAPARAPHEEAPLPEITAYLLLDVAGTPCALPRDAVAEVLPLPRLHQPPAGGGPLAGFLDLGGVPVPVVDLARLLGLRDAGTPSGDDPYRHLVLAADRKTAFLVDRADDLVRVADSAIRPVSESRTLNGCVVGEIAGAQRLVHVLDLGRLLTEEERARLADLTRMRAERLAAFAGSAA